MLRYRPHMLALVVIAAFGLLIFRSSPQTVSRMDNYPIEKSVGFADVAMQQAEENQSDKLVRVDYDVPLVWVGGVPRSGTTLMRAMLDAHEAIRCGEETHVIPKMLDIHRGFTNNRHLMGRLDLAHIDMDTLEAALGAYLLTVIEQHGPPADLLCNKDPFTLTSIPVIESVFPNSKFLLMIRDGRASAHSIVSRKITISNWDIKTFKGALEGWNKTIANMYNKCMDSGPMKCLPVYYEQLVLHPRSQMERILAFLDTPWDESVLHHEQTIGKEGGVSLSKKEPSTDQVNKPVNLDALTKWAEHIPDGVKRDIDRIAPMLKVLGYDPHAFPPNYGTPDKEVIENTKNLKDFGTLFQ